MNDTCIPQVSVYTLTGPRKRWKDQTQWRRNNPGWFTGSCCCC